MNGALEFFQVECVTDCADLGQGNGFARFPLKDQKAQRAGHKLFRTGLAVSGAGANSRRKACSTIAAESRTFVQQNREKPFFLYMTSHSIHVPRAPNPRFVGKSDCGVRGDAIVGFDWMVGQIMEEVDALGLAGKTLIMVSSDNGGINDDNGPDKIHGIGDPDATNGHQPNTPYRGTRSSVFEGGTPVPFILRRPGKVKPGESAALLSHVDLPASLAALAQVSLPPGAARDSENLLPALPGQSPQGRTWLLPQSNTGAPSGLRHGHWKLLPDGSGKGGPREAALYKLASDPGKATNVIATHPDIAASMMEKLQSITGTSGKSGPRKVRKQKPGKP